MSRLKHLKEMQSAPMTDRVDTDAERAIFECNGQNAL